ncbi:hypothetical protein ACFWP2_21310 [Kitasatospora sp. NPDC058444]|uniref:hypothetical protein n=1 Tax=Kitasatospora sp. NPDC058444 TaxID=3346504 RepID=UPI003662F595
MVLEPDPGVFVFLNPSTNRFVFISNDREGDDFVMEAHPDNELRNRFTAIPVA